jgi:hypothetical protein
MPLADAPGRCLDNSDSNADADVSSIQMNSNFRAFQTNQSISNHSEHSKLSGTFLLISRQYQFHQFKAKKYPHSSGYTIAGKSGCGWHDFAVSFLLL